MPLYLFYGTENFLIEERLQQFVKSIPADLSVLNCTVLDGNTVTVGEIINAADTLPVFCAKRVVIVKDFSLLKAGAGRAEKEEALFANYLISIPSSTDLILTVYGTVDKRKKLYKQITTYGQVQEINNLTGEKLNAWIQRRVQTAGKRIEKSAIQYLISNNGNQLQLLVQEIEKLIDFTGNRAEISIDDIKAIGQKKLNVSIFDLVDSVVGGNVQQALLLLTEILQQGETAVKILFMITRQYRIIFQSKLLKEQGLSVQQIASATQQQTFVITKCLQMAQEIKMNQAPQIFRLLAQADQDLKTGKLNPVLVLEKLIMELHMIK